MTTAFSRKIMTGIEKIIALIKSTIDSYHNTSQSSHANGFNHSITVTGSMTATNGFSTTNPSHLKSIELGNGNNSSSNNGGFIDFHYNGSTADYTARIIEETSGVIKLSPALTTTTATITTANITTANITTTVSNTIKPNNTNYVKIVRDGKANTALSIEGYNNPLVRIKNKGVDYRNMQVDKGSGYVALSSSNTFAESGEASLNVDTNEHYIALDGTDLRYGSFTVDGTTYTGAFVRHYLSIYRRYTSYDEEGGANFELNQYETNASNQVYWLTTNCLLVNVKCQTPINAKDVANKQYVDNKTFGFPNYSARTRVINGATTREEINTALNNGSTESNVFTSTYTVPNNGYVRIDCSGTSNVLNREYFIFVYINNYVVFRSSFSNSFYRNDAATLIPVKKGQTIKFRCSANDASTSPKATSQLGHSLTFDFIPFA